jgi:signal transduction histidine kinase
VIFRSVRFRITALAVAVVAAVLVATSFGLVALQRRALTAGIDDALTGQAEDIIAAVRSGELDPGLAPSAREGFAQLVDTDGALLAATPNLAAPLEVAGAGIRTVGVPEVDDDVFRVLTRQIEGVGTLTIGTTYEVVNESTAALANGLFVMIPIVLVVLGGLVWLLVGRTLRPVEAIRREVARIEPTDLRRRVPQPGTGDEIDRLAATMNDMLGRLQRSTERQQRFVADASHDLRTPLARMRATLEVGGDVDSLLADVIEMQLLVEDLLYLARADEGQLAMAVGPLDLDDLVLREVRRLEARHRVGIDYSQVSAAHVEGDAGQLTRAIRNLVDNAERHAASKVTLSLAETNGSAVLTVEDDGPGVGSGDAEVIFERFTRLDDARATGMGGAGLGLAIARDIVERHGGTVRLRSTTGPGATFELAMPLAG